MPNPIDEIASKGMGVIKGVKARIHGLSGVFMTLAEQHGEASVLLNRVQGNPDKRMDLWPTIRKELVSHERGEMATLYPELRNYPATRALADQHDLEAHDLEEQINKIQATAMNSATWETLFDKLVEMVVAHAEEEETMIFPKALEVIGADKARELDARFKAAQDSAKAAL